MHDKTSIKSNNILEVVRSFYDELKLTSGFILYNFAGLLWLDIVRTAEGIYDDREMHFVHILSNNKDMLNTLERRFGKTIYCDGELFKFFYIHRNGNKDVCR